MIIIGEMMTSSKRVVKHTTKRLPMIQTSFNDKIIIVSQRNDKQQENYKSFLI